MRWVWIGALAAFAVDQLSKLIVVHWLNLKEIGTLLVAPPYLVFRMGWNTGANFGLMAGADWRWFWIGLAVVISGLIVWWATRLEGWLPRLAAGLVIGGALANAFDRLLYGAVADFLNMSCCGIQNPYAFNLADVFIFAGAAGLAIWGETRTRKNTP